MRLASVTELDPLRVTFAGSAQSIPVWKTYDSVTGLALDDLVVVGRVGGRYVIEGRLV